MVSQKNPVSQQTAKKGITGVVKDSKGEPVIGANIIEKGTPANGTVTDIDGNDRDRKSVV